MSPRSVEASRRQRERAKKRILAGSFRAFRDNGFHRTSMGEVARVAGVSKGLAYNYFPSKEALLATALEARLDHLLGLVEGVSEHGDPRSRLESFIDGVLEQAERDPESFRLFLAVSLDPGVRSVLREELRALQDRVDRYMGRVESLLAELGSPDPRLESLLIRSTLLGLCVRLVQTGARLPVPELRARLLELHAPRREA